jgi:lipid-binding SYLF domain-containing protein
MKMKAWSLVGVVATLLLATSLTASAEGSKLDSEVKDAIDMFKKSDTRMQSLFDGAYGYAVFPSIGKTAIGVGGAEGRGEVFENGSLIGKAKMTQVTVGAQLGAQQYAEVIFFETKDALTALKDDKWSTSAEISAIAVSEGAAATAKYRRGVIVFTILKTGLMFEASVGGQKFEYHPIPEKNTPQG